MRSVASNCLQQGASYPRGRNAPGYPISSRRVGTAPHTLSINHPVVYCCCKLSRLERWPTYERLRAVGVNRCGMPFQSFLLILGLLNSSAFEYISVYYTLPGSGRGPKSYKKNQLSEKNEVASWTGHTIRLRDGPLVSPLGDHTTRTDDKGGEMTWTNPEEATRSGRGQHNTG